MAKKTTTPHNSALISGSVIEWARKRVGKTHEQIADEMGGSVQSEDVAQWEANENLPDFRKAQKLAIALHIPFGYLYLSRPPRNDTNVPDLRTVGSKPITAFSTDLLDQLRNLLLKQEWYRDYASAEGRKALAFVGRFSLDSSYQKVAIDIANELGINAGFRAAASNWEGFTSELHGECRSRWNSCHT